MKTFIRSTNWRSGKIVAIVCAIVLAIGTRSRLDAADAESNVNVQPNILFIFTDDHAISAISAYGSKLIQTPNIDRIAREGMLFKNCFVTNSICGPSRAVILTGRHSHENGFIDNQSRFDGSQTTFPKLLQTAGYQTAIIGKWHLVSDPTGFDHWDVLPGQGSYYNPELLSQSKTPRGSNQKRIVEGYTTDIITDLSLEWITNNRDSSKPFLLMCQHKAPHREWAPGPEELDLFRGESFPEPSTLFDDYAGRARGAAEQEMTIAHHMTALDLALVSPKNLTPTQRERYEGAFRSENEAMKKAQLSGEALVRWNYQRYVSNYLRCVAGVDRNIGRLLDFLDASGLAKNTLVIYSSDQGFYLGEHGWYDKRWMYEESLRMPLVARWPGVITPGSLDDHLVQNLEFAQTFLDIAHATTPAEMQGKSLLPLMQGKNPVDWRSSVYYHYYEFPQPHRVPSHYGIRTDQHKLIWYDSIGDWELFDLKNDPQELRSIHADPNSAELFKNLRSQLLKARKTAQDNTGQPFPIDEM